LESAIGAEPLSKGLSNAFVRVSAQDFQGRVAAGTGRCGGWRKTRNAAEDRRGAQLLPAKHDLPKHKRSRDDGVGTGTHCPGVWKPL
jgi:hypothetical protein